MLLVEVHLKKDQDSYFLGNIIEETSNYLILEAVDENGYLGGSYFIKKSAISKVETESDEIEEMKDKISDPFNLKKKNEELLKKYLAQQDIGKLCQKNSLIYLETANENYHGKVKSINSKEVILTELDYEKQLSDVNIGLDEIQVVSFNLLEDRLLDEFLNSETFVKNADLVEIYLTNHSLSEQDEFLVGKIIKENKDYIVIEFLNDLGQLDSILAIKTSVIKKIIKEDNYLNYLEFLKQWQKKNQSYDLKEIRKSLETSNLDNLLLKKIKTNKAATSKEVEVVDLIK